MNAGAVQIPLVPEPLAPLKEEATGTNGRGPECPPSGFVGSGSREPSGTNGNHRHRAPALCDPDREDDFAAAGDDAWLAGSAP